MVSGVARAYGAEVDLVFVDLEGMPPHRIEARLDPHRRTLERAGVRARSLVVAPIEGQAVSARLVEIIDREGADLVIVPTGGRTGVIRWTLGAVGEGVLKGCRRPVLIWPVAGAPERRAAPRSSPGIRPAHHDRNMIFIRAKRDPAGSIVTPGNTRLDPGHVRA